MASRRQVRQAAVQLLYARSASPADQGGADLWDLINDKAAVEFDRARVKILAHFQQGRESLAAKFQTILVDSAAAILAVDPSEKFARELKAHRAAEQAWAESCGNLHRLAKANTGGWQRDLHQLLPKSDKLTQKRAEILPRTETFPPAQQKALTEVFAKLDTYDSRVRMVRFPEKYPDQRDLDHLHRLTQEMKILETEAVALADQIESELPALDEKINEASSNFDINRFSKVDLAIVRLATWEISNLPDLDHAISINEAVELARSFSGEESASFVNGVLDHLAKAQN